jgi:mannonate dehydratase
MREVKQLGVNHVLIGGPSMPWTDPQLRSMMDKCRAGGLTIGNMMIGGFPNTVYGRPGRDQEIEHFKDSIRAAGKVGMPTIEYNFYAHRAMEGYYEVDGWGGAGLTGFDIDRMKTLRPLPKDEVYSLDEMWKNITANLDIVLIIIILILQIHNATPESNDVWCFG